jgi:hypothetical protein
MPKPDDEEILKRWGHVCRLYHRGGGFAQRIALALADRMEADGITEADIDRIAASNVRRANHVEG